MTHLCLRLSWTALPSVRFFRIGHVFPLTHQIPSCSMEFYAYASLSISRQLHVLSYSFLFYAIQRILGSLSNRLKTFAPLNLWHCTLGLTWGRSVSSWVPPLRQSGFARSTKSTSRVTVGDCDFLVSLFLTRYHPSEYTKDLCRLVCSCFLSIGCFL